MRKEKNAGKIIIKVSIMWIFIIGIIIGILMAFFKNNIFATDRTSNEENEVEEIAAVEKNANAVDILELMVENNYINKKLINREKSVEFETIRQETPDLPKGEEKVLQKGEKGKNRLTIIQTYNEGKKASEEIIETIVEKEPKKELILVGTSEFLSKYNVHLGDEMYLIEAGELKKEAKEDSEKLCDINRYLNVKLQEVKEGWARIQYNEFEGYIQIEKLTSETVTPMIAEKNRIATLQAKLNLNMDLSIPSGLTLSDYKTIFTYNANDKNSIFSQNAEVFYNIEQKYNINGIFVAAIGIHESAWGTSRIAQDKNNLFGYKAYDRDPYNSAQQFVTYEECINTVAEALKNNYLTTTGSFYNGTTLEAVNTRYASDKEWHKKVYTYMEYLYDKLG